ncbi:MAG: hypothetical protein AAFV07_17085, partial [Bacteroidota bacterium]
MLSSLYLHGSFYLDHIQMKTDYYYDGRQLHRAPTWPIWLCMALLSVCIPTKQIFSQQYLAFDHLEGMGLGAVTVTGIGEGPGGFLWLSSEQGLFRYDGYNFHAYTCPTLGQTASKDVQVTSLYSDSHKNVWAGTVLGYLLRYDPATDSMIVAWSPPRDAISGRGYPQIRTILEDTLRGHIWVAHSAGLLQISPDTIRVYSPNANLLPDHVMNHEIRSMVLHHNTIWLGYRDGWMSELDLDTLRFQHWNFSESLNGEYAEIQRYVNGTHWIAGPSRGIYRFDPVSHTFTYENIPSPIFQVCGILPREAGGLWIASGSGLIEWNPEQNHYRRYTHQLNDPLRSLPATPVKAIYQQHNTLWIGSGTEGLAKAGLDVPFQYARINANAQSSEW